MFLSQIQKQKEEKNDLRRVQSIDKIIQTINLKKIKSQKGNNRHK